MFDSDPENVALAAPDDQLANSGDLAYGEEFPEFELPDATSDVVIDTGSLDSVALATTFFASCPDECGILLNSLAGIQAELIDRGLSGDVLFLPITFDPARDDEEKLRENAAHVGADLDAGNWHNLRPADTDEADTIVTDQLGIGYDRADSDRLGGYDFSHIVVTWLLNPSSVVERVYRGETLDRRRILDDIEKLLDKYDPEAQR
jgi:protein SCO1/2